jgi:hypothetical protein
MWRKARFPTVSRGREEGDRFSGGPAAWVPLRAAVRAAARGAARGAPATPGAWGTPGFNVTRGHRQFRASEPELSPGSQAPQCGLGCAQRTEGRLGCVERTEGHIGALRPRQIAPGPRLSPHRAPAAPNARRVLRPRRTRVGTGRPDRGRACAALRPDRCSSRAESAPEPRAQPAPTRDDPARDATHQPPACRPRHTGPAPADSGAPVSNAPRPGTYPGGRGEP